MEVIDLLENKDKGQKLGTIPNGSTFYFLDSKIKDKFIKIKTFKVSEESDKYWEGDVLCFNLTKKEMEEFDYDDKAIEVKSKLIIGEE